MTADNDYKFKIMQIFMDFALDVVYRALGACPQLPTPAHTSKNMFRVVFEGVMTCGRVWAGVGRPLKGSGLS